jgi:hypothetical protein
MEKRLQILIGTVTVAALAMVATSSAQDGVITDANPTLSYTRGPFTGANPSNNVGDEPDCETFPGTCSDFALQVDLPAGYTEAHPNHRITVQVAWDPTAPGNDFDLYIQDPVTGLSVVPPAATSSNPEATSIPLADGVRNFRLRVLVFSVINTSYTATVTLEEPSDVPGVGTYAESNDVWTCNQHLEGLSEIPGPPPTIFDHSQDGEPSVRFDPNGRAYATAIAGVPAGSGLWATNDACGQAYEFIGAVDAGAGGGDSDVETAPEPNILGNYNVYLSSLTLANITTAASFDGGTNFVVTPISTPQPVDDRQWNAAHGSSICYLSYWQFPSGIIEVVRMDYTTLGAPVIAGPFQVNALSSQEFNRIGNLATDRRPLPPGSLPFMAGPDGEGMVYQAYVNAPGSKVMVASSADFGVTWTNTVVWDGGAGVSYDHVFDWLTVDGAGNVYVAFSDDGSIYYSVSQDRGLSWSHPIRVNRGGASRTAIFPQLAAGSEGRLAVTFYGHDLTGSQNADANWKVFVSRSQNALSPVPHFEEMIVNDRQFHTGPVCQQGLDCACCRELTECFEIDINPQDGSGFVTYGSFGGGGSYITRQVKGISSIEGLEVPDRSETCPTPPDCEVVECTEPPCQCPGCEVVADLDADDAPPAPGPESNIQSVAVAEPFDDPRGDDVLVFSIKVEDLDLANLPPNTFWRVIFTTDAMHYVKVTNCQVGGLSGDYGHFTTGSVSDGPLDHFEVNDDGLICMWIDRDLVGDPQPGQFISAINADSRVYVGDCPSGSGAFAPLDVTNSGQYTVRGNDACAVNAQSDDQASAVRAFAFGLAGANPFTGETQVSFSLPERGRVRIDVYNVAGQRVHTLVNRDHPAGKHTVAFNPQAAGRLGAGVYWLKIKAGGFEDQVRVVSLK